MTILWFYLLISITTSLTALYEVINPALTMLELTHPNDPLIQNKFVALLVLFGMCLLAAPILLPVVLIPSWGAWFREKLIETWTAE
jgi:tellurite resistance protein TehA-like permease